MTLKYNFFRSLFSLSSRFLKSHRSIQRFQFFLLFSLILLLNFVKANHSPGSDQPSNHRMLLPDDEKSNVFNNLLKKFDIPSIHGSGVFVDLGGTAGGKFYFPSGKCPVYGKVLILGSGAYFLDENKGLVYPFTDGNGQRIIRKYKTYAECVRNSKFSTKYKDEDVYLPFVYDTNTQICHSLVTSFQKYETASKDKNIVPYKDVNANHILFGNVYNRLDYEKECPKNFVLGGQFGKWVNSKCNDIEYSFAKMRTPGECSQYLFIHSPDDSSNGQTYGHGINQANFISESEECRLILGNPDCIYNSPKGLMLTSVGSPNIKDLELIQCVEATENWIVHQPCPESSFGDSLYVQGIYIVQQCSKGNWITTDNKCPESSRLSLLIIILITGGALIAVVIVGSAIYFLSKRSRSSKVVEEKRTTTSNTHFSTGHSNSHSQTDVLGEASFWTDVKAPTNVTLVSKS